MFLIDTLKLLESSTLKCTNFCKILYIIHLNIYLKVMPKVYLLYLYFCMFIYLFKYRFKVKYVKETVTKRNFFYFFKF